MQQKNTFIQTTDDHTFAIDSDGRPYDIPIGGSIGLLALGDLGIIAWRQKQQQLKAELAERTRQHLSITDAKQSNND